MRESDLSFLRRCGQRPENMAVDIIDRYKDTETARKLKDKRICVVSGDLHYFGLYVITRVLEGPGS